MMLYKGSVFLHLLFVAFWLGGMLFTAAVLVPATRKKLKEQRGLLFTELGTRFSRISWFLFPLLFLTGTTALLGKGFSLEYLLSAGFWSGSYGSALGQKLTLFGSVLIISAIHDFWLGPKASELMEREPDESRTKQFRKASSWAGRLNMVAGLAILYTAITLVRG
jgi:putative copper export protein